MVAAPPRFDSNGASASRGRSTPATRAASAAAATDSSSKESESGEPAYKAPGARAGAGLIAKLEEKKRQEKAGNESALT